MSPGLASNGMPVARLASKVVERGSERELLDQKFNEERFLKSLKEIHPTCALLKEVLH